MTAPVPAPIGVVGHYNLLERLEPAGPGALYRARDTRLGRTVAVRILPEGFVDDGQRAAFLERARSLIALSHPNIATVFDIGEDGPRLYLVFEFLKGQSLRAEALGLPMNPRRAVELAVQIADAIADAHASGFMHGGLSPDSIVITARGHAKIPVSELAARSGFEESAGPFRLHDYAAPEEAGGHAADERSDVYSVGAVLYEMLTARRPGPRGAAAPSAANPEVPPELDEIVLRAIAPNAESRHQSAAALAGELRASLAILDAHDASGGEAATAARQTRGGGGRIAAVLIMLVLAALIWWLAS